MVVRSFKSLLLILITLCVVSCSRSQNDISSEYPCVLVIDLSNANNKAQLFSEGSAVLEIYLINKLGWRDTKKAPNGLTTLMRILNIDETSGYEALSYYTYKLAPRKIIRDYISIPANAEKILIAMKQQEELTNHKLIEIKPSKTRITRVDVVGDEIKININ